MTELVRFELEDGSAVLFEASGEEGVIRVGRGDAAAAEGGRLRERLATAARAAQAVSAEMRERVTPDELTLEMGLKLSGEANWFVARSNAECTVKVTLKWKNPPADGTPG